MDIWWAIEDKDEETKDREGTDQRGLGMSRTAMVEGDIKKTAFITPGGHTSGYLCQWAECTQGLRLKQ